MKIRGKKPGSIAPQSKVPRQGAGVKGKKASSEEKLDAADSVDISGKAKDLNKVKRLLEAIPEIRGDMVVKIKTDLERGRYYVNVGKVAEKMIERALSDAMHADKKVL